MADDTGVRGHSILPTPKARSKAVPDLNDTSTRNLALKELHLARAFTYAVTKRVSGKKYSAGMPTACKALCPLRTRNIKL